LGDFTEKYLIGQQNPSGEIALHSDWLPCIECEFMFLDFNLQYPNMQLQLSYTWKDVEEMIDTIQNGDVMNIQPQLTSVYDLAAYYFTNQFKPAPIKGMTQTQIIENIRYDLAIKITELINSPEIDIELRTQLITLAYLFPQYFN
jgi:hypothetical protein